MGEYVAAITAEDRERWLVAVRCIIPPRTTDAVRLAIATLRTPDARFPSGIKVGVG